MTDTIELTEEFRALVAPLQATFERVLRGQAIPENGIYPVFVNGEVKGIRLGEEIAKEAGSACFIASTHQNELIGWKAFDDILNKWENQHNNKPALKDANLEGDIYLIFGGQKERVEELFSKLLDPDRDFISIKEYTDYRERVDEDGNRANANRVRYDLLGTTADRFGELSEAEQNQLLDTETLKKADQQLVLDNSGLKKEVFSKCKLVLDIHSMSQPAKTVLIPPPPKGIFLANDHSQERQESLLKAMGRRWLPFAENMGVEDMHLHFSIDQHGNAFTGTEKSADNFRGLFEGGGPHTDPAIWEKGVQALESALGTLWPEKLDYLIKPEQKSKPQAYGLTTHFYLPGCSTLADKHMPKEAKLCHNTGKLPWNFLTGGENIPPEVMEENSQRCPNATLEPNRLANGVYLAAGEPIAYSYNADTREVSLLAVPEGRGGIATMFPADAKNRIMEESIGAVAPKLDLRLSLTKGVSWVNWAEAVTNKGIGMAA